MTKLFYLVRVKVTNHNSAYESSKRSCRFDISRRQGFFDFRYRPRGGIHS